MVNDKLLMLSEAQDDIRTQDNYLSTKSADLGAGGVMSQRLPYLFVYATEDFVTDDPTLSWEAETVYQEGDKIVADNAGTLEIYECTTTTPDDWAAESAYLEDANILVNNGGTLQVFTCSTAGTTGTTEPTWDTENPVSDGTAAWTYVEDYSVTGETEPTWSDAAPIDDGTCEWTYVSAKTLQKIAIQVVCADDEALSTNLTVINTVATVDAADLVAGRYLYKGKLPEKIARRYLGVRYAGTGNFTAGKLTAGLAEQVPMDVQR